MATVEEVHHFRGREAMHRWASLRVGQMDGLAHPNRCTIPHLSPPSRPEHIEDHDVGRHHVAESCQWWDPAFP